MIRAEMPFSSCPCRRSMFKRWISNCCCSTASKYVSPRADLSQSSENVCQTLTSKPYDDKLFDIIFDWTAFSQSSQIPTHWLKFAYEIIPVDIRRRFRVSRMLTPNALALRYMRRLYNLTNGRFISSTSLLLRLNSPFLGATLSTQYVMHTSTTELIRNYPEGTALPSLQYASKRNYSCSCFVVEHLSNAVTSSQSRGRTS